MKFPNAAKGVRKIFSAEILKLIAIVCLIAGLICLILMLASVGNGSDAGAGASAIGVLIFVGGAFVLMAVAAIMKLVGIVQSSRDESSFTAALVCILIEVVALIVSGFIAPPVINPSGSVDINALSAISNSVSLNHLIMSIANLLITVFIITGVIKLADQLNDGSVSAKGANLLKIIIVINGLAIIASIVSLIFGANSATAVTCGILLLVALILEIVQYFMYLSLLSNGKKMLVRN